MCLMTIPSSSPVANSADMKIVTPAAAADSELYAAKKRHNDPLVNVPVEGFRPLERVVVVAAGEWTAHTSTSTQLTLEH